MLRWGGHPFIISAKLGRDCESGHDVPDLQLGAAELTWQPSPLHLETTD